MATSKIDFDHWTAHERPGQPLTYGAWLCCCQECAVALHALATKRPGANIVLKSAMDRQVLTAIDVAAARVDGDFEDLLCEPGDYLREVFVGRGPDFEPPQRGWRVDLPPPSTWRPCEECAEDADFD